MKFLAVLLVLINTLAFSRGQLVFDTFTTDIDGCSAQLIPINQCVYFCGEVYAKITTTNVAYGDYVMEYYLDSACSQPAYQNGQYLMRFPFVCLTDGQYSPIDNDNNYVVCHEAASQTTTSTTTSSTTTSSTTTSSTTTSSSTSSSQLIFDTFTTDINGCSAQLIPINQCVYFCGGVVWAQITTTNAGYGDYALEYYLDSACSQPAYQNGQYLMRFPFICLTDGQYSPIDNDNNYVVCHEAASQTTTSSTSTSSTTTSSTTTSSSTSSTQLIFDTFTTDIDGCSAQLIPINQCVYFCGGVVWAQITTTNAGYGDYALEYYLDSACSQPAYQNGQYLKRFPFVCLTDGQYAPVDNNNNYVACHEASQTTTSALTTTSSTLSISTSTTSASSDFSGSSTLVASIVIIVACIIAALL